MPSAANGIEQFPPFLSDRVAATTIELDANDLRVGIAFELEATRARATLEGIQRAAAIFKAQLYDKYGISEETHTLADWLTGFEPRG